MKLLFLAFILSVKVFCATTSPVNNVQLVAPTNDAIKLALLESTLQDLALNSILAYFPKESQEKVKVEVNQALKLINPMNIPRILQLLPQSLSANKDGISPDGVKGLIIGTDIALNSVNNSSGGSQLNVDMSILNAAVRKNTLLRLT